MFKIIQLSLGLTAVTATVSDVRKAQDSNTPPLGNGEFLGQNSFRRNRSVDDEAAHRSSRLSRSNSSDGV